MLVSVAPETFDGCLKPAFCLSTYCFKDKFDGSLKDEVAAVRNWEEKTFVLPLDGGEPHLLPAIVPEERALRWDATGKFLFVCREESGTVFIERLAVSTGERVRWNEIAPSSGASAVDVRLAADGRAAVYSYVHVKAYLYVVEGLR